MSRRSAKAYDRDGAALAKATTKTWSRRAIVAYNKFKKTGDQDAFLAAEEHRHEALEHAALVGDEGNTVARTQRYMDNARELAWRKL